MEKKDAHSSDPISSPQRFTTNYEIDDHLLSLPSLIARYSVNLNISEPENSHGLSSSQIPDLLLKYGPNVLSPPKEIPEWVKFLHHLLDLFNILLFIGGILAFIAYILDSSDSTTIYLGCFLFFIVLFDSVIGYMQERSSSNVMGKFKKMLPPHCTVIRDGVEKQIPAEEVVVGDLIKVQGGGKIPADMRIIHCQGLKVEQSALNGESEPVEVSEKSLSNHFIESRNVVFNGCLCLEGSALGLAIKTGDNTYLGIIAQQTAQIHSGETPLQKEIKSFVKFISILGITLGIIVFSIGAARGTSNFLNLFVQGFIIVIIANIPQGLPATVVSCLTIIAYRMSQQNVYIKKLESIETLGSATVIASDKTGTLTMNKMTVEHLWFDCQIYSADFIEKNYQDMKKNKSWHQLFKVGVLCNKAFFQITKENDEGNDEGLFEFAEKKNHIDENLLVRNELKSDENVHQKEKSLIKSNSLKSQTLLGKLSKKAQKNETKNSFETFSDNSEDLIKELKHQQSIELQKFHDLENYKERRKILNIIGDATETAILRFCDGFKQTDDYREKYKKIFELPFNSKNKFQVSIHEIKSQKFLVMKGAPEIVFSKCSSFLKNGKKNAMKTEFKEDFEKAYTMLGKKGERVLGCAYLMIDNADLAKNYANLNANMPLKDLCFVGLYSLMDPPKKGVGEAILHAKKAGIKVFMITGDHPLTAEAIARKVNIIEFDTIDEIVAAKRCNPADISPNMALAAVVSGSEISTFTPEKWRELLLSKRELVFARISPQQKVEIVENLQKLKEVVIVTGDGVNDAIALKKADIGVAMGKGGSDVAKEAAEVIFIDDEFRSIISGIKEGRTLFDNLKKTIVYTLTHCILELAPILLNVSAGLPLGFNSLQMLSVDLGTELGPAISLAYEEAEDDILERPPRNLEKDRLMSYRLLAYSYLEAGVIEAFFCFVAYFWVYSDNGLEMSELFGLAPDYFDASATTSYVSNSGMVYSVDEQTRILNTASTAWYVTCVMGQFFNIWMCKTRQQTFLKHTLRNSMTIYGVLLEVAILLIVVYIPQFQGVFSTVALEGKYWFVCLGSGFCLILFNESRKYWTRQYANGKIADYFMW